MRPLYSRAERGERQGGALALMVAPGVPARGPSSLSSRQQSWRTAARPVLPADTEALAPGSPRPDDAFSVH